MALQEKLIYLKRTSYPHNLASVDDTFCAEKSDSPPDKKALT